MPPNAVTETQAAHPAEALTHFERRLSLELLAAINTFKGGFALYDANERLVVANDAVAQFSPDIAEFLVPGARMEDVTRRIAAARGHEDA